MRKNPQLYHGTGVGFERPDPKRFETSALFGPGLYLTDSPAIASSYAEGRAPSLYLARERVGYYERRVEEFKREVAGAKQRGFEKERWFGELKGHLSLAEDDLGRAREHLRVVESSGPNVRVVQVPENLQLLETDKRVPDAIVARVQEIMGPLSGLRANLTGAMLWEAIRDNLPLKGGNLAQRTNELLASVGLDGIRYRGGKRVPMKDDQGHPIEHDVTVVFQSSLPKVKPGFEPGKMANPRWRR